MKTAEAALLAVALLAPTAPQAGFVVEEYFDPVTQSGSFGVRNTGTDAVVAFAVANDTLFGSDGTHELYRIWATGLISEANWDLQKGTFEAAIGQPIPAFGTLFPGYHKAAVYWAHDILPAPEQAAVAGLSWEPGSLRLRDPINQSCPCYLSLPIPGGDDATYAHLGILGFYFNATSPGSPFVALTQNFQFIQGEAQVVAIPEPQSVVLLLAGLGLVGWRLRSAR